MNKINKSLPADFREFLQVELVRRIGKNPSYSMRSFAQFLGVHSGSLSQYINGKRDVSIDKIEVWAKKLELSPRQIEKFTLSKTNTREKVSVRTRKEISLDCFEVLSEWYHLSILELCKTEDFKPRTSWIAKRLGIHSSEVKMAIHRLKRLGFLEESEEGNLRAKDTDFSTLSHDYTTLALQRLQKQILEKGISAIEDTAYEDRLQTTLSVAIDSKKLAEVKKRINTFAQELNQYIEGFEVSDEVYHISFTAYPVSK